MRGYKACPFVDLEYVKKAQKRGWKVDARYVHEGHRDLKPNIGMLEKCATCIGTRLDIASLYVLGDRASDVKLGLNGGGMGILINSAKTRELDDTTRVELMMRQYPNRVYIAEDFLDAARYIERRIR